MVVISCPSQLAASIVQDIMAVPSTSTVQAPHDESSQARLEPVSPIFCRSTSSKSALDSIASSCGRPLIRSSTSSFFIGNFWLLALGLYLLAHRLGQKLRANSQKLLLYVGTFPST